MTSPRRQRKPRLARPFFFLATVALVAAGLGLGVKPGEAVTERIVVDPNTGVALSGFDPVAYFVDGKARLGRNEVEYDFSGAVWQFDNIGNRAAFAAHPEVYAPRYGGYDPIAIARGVATPGHPLIWLVSGQRLYLFYSPETRKAFAAYPERAVAEANRAWPRVRLGLVP